MTQHLNKADANKGHGKELDEVGSLFIRGESQRTIAKKLGLSQPTVSRLLAEYLREFQEAAAGETDRHRAVELGKLAEIERTAWCAYEESRATENLGIIAKVVAFRCRILGVERPVKSEIAFAGPPVLSRAEMLAEVKKRVAAFMAPK